MSDHLHHEGSHEDKLCALTCCPGRIKLDELRPLVKNAQHICSECGRTAAEAENLCSPQKL